MAAATKSISTDSHPPLEGAEPGAPVRASWREARLADHFVQFYRSDEVLVEAAAGFVGAGLQTVEGGIVIATADHRAMVEERLVRKGIDLYAARQRRQYVPLDAAGTLAGFMVGGMPSERLFHDVVGGHLTRMLSTGFRVRVFGEMAALLWLEGNPAAAHRVEELFNSLGRVHRFSLFCAYPFARFAGADETEYRRICGAHQGVIVAEPAQ